MSIITTLFLLILFYAVVGKWGFIIFFTLLGLFGLGLFGFLTKHKQLTLFFYLICVVILIMV
ncbi:MAG: hypothetical protein ACRC9P_04065, partial [Bacteroides sp.]